MKLREAKIPNTNFVRISEADDMYIEYYIVERNGGWFLLSYEHSGSNIKYDIEAKGSKSTIRNAFKQTIDNILRNVSGHAFQYSNITATKIDTQAKEHMRIFFDNKWGLNFGKSDTIDYDKKDAIQKDFNKLLERQLREWRGGTKNLALVKHKFFKEFVSMVREKIPTKITLYRGIHSEQAVDVLNGQSFEVAPYSSWTIDINIAKDISRYGSSGLGKKQKWLVVKRDFKNTDIILAPVVLEDYIEPDILLHFRVEKEYIVKWPRRNIKVKIVQKTRSK